MTAEAPSDLDMLRLRVRRQESVIGEMRQRIRELEAMLMPEAEVPAAWKLTPTEKAIFRVLLGRELVTKRSIHFALHEGRDDSPDVRVIHVHMLRIRAKLRPFGVQVTTHHGEGYHLQARLSWRAKLGVPDTTASPQPESQTA